MSANPTDHHQRTTALARPSIETSILDDLAARMKAINPAWRLVRENGELVLHGNTNGSPDGDAWITDESCVDWLRHMERARAKRLKQQEKRRAARAARANHQ